MTRSRLTPARADVLAASLEVPLDCGICLACLSFVSMAVDDDDPGGVAREARRMTPYLWDEGLAEPALAAAAEAARRGGAEAAVALADLRERGGRSAVARALVRRLAIELAERVRAELRVDEQLRRAGPGTRPELN